MKNTLTLLLLSISSQIQHHQVSCIFKVVEELDTIIDILYYLSKPGADCADVSNPGADCTDVPKPGADCIDVPKPGADGVDVPKPGADGAVGADVPKPGADGAVGADVPKPGADGTVGAGTPNGGGNTRPDAAVDVDVSKPGATCSFVPSCKLSGLSESPDTIILILSTTISKLNSKPSGPQTLYAPTPAGFSIIFPLDC